jgi:hypothetical protein
MADGDELTRLIRDAKEGGEEQAAALFDRVYSELHGLAVRRMEGERPGHTLQATARTVRREWAVARAYLAREVAGPSD